MLKIKFRFLYINTTLIIYILLIHNHINICFIPEFNSLTKDDIAFVTESAATNKSFLKLRFGRDPLALEFKLDVLTGVPIQRQ